MWIVPSGLSRLPDGCQLPLKKQHPPLEGGLWRGIGIMMFLPADDFPPVGTPIYAPLEVKVRGCPPRVGPGRR